MKTFTAEERKKFILDYVKENEFVDITYLKDTLLVSEMTIRRDLKKLEEENLMEDTLIIFSSDNGFNCGHHGIWGKGNGTFPLNMYDSSVKVPLIMCHKGHIPENQVCDEMHSGYDFMP